MKTAAKVFLIIGMVLQFVLIFPIVVGCLTINKINTARDKSELTTLGILATLFCSVLGGILTLCITNEELRGVQQTYSAPKPVQQIAAPAQKSEPKDEQTYIEKIKELKKLLDDNVLTQEEYDQLKKEILDKSSK